jgi:membrane-bound serine protease (ClpP class)
VIEVIADSRENLFKQIEGRTVTKNKKTIKLNLAAAAIELYPMSAIQKLLHMIGHPNVAYILMMIGIYGIIYEFSNPGVGLGGVVGGISLLLAFYSLQVLPISTVGLTLILFGIACLIVELLTPTHGLLTLGGLVAFCFGSFMLIDVPRDLSVPRISLHLILPTVLVTGAFFTFVLQRALATRRFRPVIGVESLEGSIAEVRQDFSPDGMVFLNGELWTAESADPLKAGDTAVVIGQKGNRLKVKKYSK